MIVPGRARDGQTGLPGTRRAAREPGTPCAWPAVALAASRRYLAGV